MDFSEYQHRAHATDESKSLNLSVSGLVGEVGSIVSTYKKRLLYRRNYPNFKREMSEELGDTLWYLASVATLSGLSLNDIAAANLKKAGSLFDEGEPQWFDRSYPIDEQFPRKFDELRLPGRAARAESSRACKTGAQMVRTLVNSSVPSWPTGDAASQLS